MPRTAGTTEEDTKVTEENQQGLYTKKSYTITLPIKKDDKSDVTVIVNGKVTIIKRGVEVEVSPEVYEILKNSERMDQLAIIRQREASAN